jgi:methionine-rich copper-binding protein CopC
MEPVSWAFETAPVADAIPPTIVALSPAPGATGIALNPAINVTFDEGVQLNALTLTLRNPSGGTVASTLALDPTTRTASLATNASLAANTTYTATLTNARDLAGNLMAPQSWSFTTRPNPSSPYLISQGPAVGRVGVAVGTTVTARFNTNMQAATIHGGTFQILDGLGVPVPAIVAYNSTNRTATLTPSAPLNPATTYTPSLSGIRDSANRLLAPTSWTFRTAPTLEGTPPVASPIAPAPGATGVSIHADASASFSEDVQGATMAFTLRIGTGAPVAASLTYDPATRVVTLDPNAALRANTTYTASISGARDLAGNLMATRTWTFATGAVDTTAPNLSSRSPGVNATNVAVLSDVVAVFNEDMQAASLEFSLAGPGGIAVPGVVSYDGASRTARFDPATSLQAGTNYTATLAGARDLAGNLMTTRTWSFTTRAATELVAPGVVATSPTDGAAGVPIASNVTATFSEAIQPTALVLTLAEPGGTPISAPVTYDTVTRTATFDPAGPLRAGAAYTATLSGVLDLAGNPMAPFVWSFATAPASDVSLPTLLSIGPADGASDVPRNTSVVATFSEPIQAATIAFELAEADGIPVPSTTNYDPANRTVTLVPMSPLAPDRVYTVSLGGARDLAGNLMTTRTWSFTAGPADLIAPTVVAVSPSPGSVGVGAFAHVTATFDESIQAATLVFTLADGSGTPVDALVSYDPVTRTATLDPSAALAPGTVYTAEVSGARDLAGNPMAPFTWTFATPSDDVTAPSVVSRTPTPGALGVPVESGVSATFSEAVQVAPLTLGLRGPSGEAVPSSFAYDPGSQTLTLTPSAPLAAGATYTASLSGVIDHAGNAMAGPVEWTFTTAHTWTQTTALDFAGGLGEGVVVTAQEDGEVVFSTATREEFLGDAIDPTWSVTSWGAVGSATVAGGVLSVAGVQVLSPPVAAGSAFEGRMAFAATPFQSFGLATALDSEIGNSWAIFSTRNTADRLFARVNVSGVTQEADLGPVDTALRLYRIQPIAGGFAFYVDGLPVATLTLAIPEASPLRIAVSSFYEAAAPITADWVTASPHRFTSAVFDAGRMASWSTADWIADLPAGTTLIVETRTGSSAAPDASWSSWTAVVNGGAVAGPSGRYFQYRARFVTGDAEVTAALRSISFDWF